MTAMFIFKEVLYFMEKKNLALYIILSIVTCGIFALVWMAMLANDLRTMSNDESKMSGGMVVLLTIVTCGIYGWIWYYQAGETLNNIKASRGIAADQSSGVLYLLLAVFGLSIVSSALIQDSLNKLIDSSSNNGNYYNY